MRNFLVLALFLSFSVISASAQSGRVAPPDSKNENVSLETLNAEKMYQEVSDYSKIKFAEFEQKKIPYSENLRLQVVREQKLLAAKYAARLAPLNSLVGLDFYYLGLLYWVSENNDNAKDNLKMFLTSENPPLEKVQTARSVLSVIAVRQKNLDEAEKFLAEYIKNPAKPSERIRMENELARTYWQAKNFPLAAAHAEASYRTTKASFQQYASPARALAEMLDTGRTVFEIYRESGNQSQVDATLEDLRKSSVVVQSAGIYFFAVDNQIKYMIQTNRKPAALDLYEKISNQIKTDIIDKAWQEDLAQRLKKRQKHYNLLGETAPELTEVSAWLPGETKSLSSLRGKVVVLDFWATWCGPCIAAFPMLVEMYETHQKDGLEILGITRYYGQVDGADADRKTELVSLEKFKKDQRLPYSFVVAENNTNQIVYGAGFIPTAVIIDRKGIIRYIETGTNPDREQEIEAVVEKLLKE